VRNADVRKFSHFSGDFEHRGDRRASVGRRRAIAAGQRISASSAAIALDICILINLRYRCVSGVDTARRAWNAGQGDEVS
jgi:hypothetical protein